MYKFKTIDMDILKNLTVTLLTVLSLFGCANSLKPIKIMGEDQKNATVNIGYIHKVPKHRANEPRDIVDETNRMAVKYCQKKDYNEAKRLGSSNEKCTGHGGSVIRWCNEYEITFQYQCI